MIQENQKDLAMAKEEKDLVMKDLCSRLPYGVYVQIVDRVGFTHTLVELNPEVIQKMWSYKSIKPYLRPMSSMTKEEKIEYLNACGNEMDNAFSSPRYGGIDYLNAHHFDYRGLIPAGHAISTKTFNPYKD